MQNVNSLGRPLLGDLNFASARQPALVRSLSRDEAHGIICPAESDHGHEQGQGEDQGQQGHESDQPLLVVVGEAHPDADTSGVQLH